MLTLPLVVLPARQMVEDQQNWRKSSILHSSLTAVSGVVLLFMESWKQALQHHGVLLHNSFLLLNAVLVYSIWLLQVDWFYFRYIFIFGVTSFWQLNRKIKALKRGIRKNQLHSDLGKFPSISIDSSVAHSKGCETGEGRVWRARIQASLGV